MVLVIEENPNCEGMERVFSQSGPIKQVHRLNVEAPQGESAWFEVTGVEEGGAWVPAKAVQVEDSGAGIAWLVYGGAWGLRYRAAGSTEQWSLTDPAQWGTPFQVLDISAGAIDFS